MEASGREANMAKVRIGERDAAQVGGLLREIGRARGFPDDIKHSARHWTGRFSRTMDRRDLQRVAWLLRDASSRAGPAEQREAARQWAAYLEGSIW
jgi:hypothetical protein